MKDEPHPRILRERLALANASPRSGDFATPELHHPSGHDPGQARGRARPKVLSARARAVGSTGTTRLRQSKCGERRVSSCSCFGS
jgi:hypothetical protein